MANSVEIVIRALDATKGGFSSATKGLQSFGKLSGAVMSAAITAAAAAGGAYLTMAKNFADSADEIGKLSQKTGIATEDLSRLKFVAEENSIEWGAFQKALRAASDEAAKSGQSFNELISSQADRFASFADGAGKAAEAQRIFGKAGADLIPLLNLGSKGLSDATKEAERFTTIIDSQTAATADEFGDTLERVGASIRKALNDGMKESMPLMLEMARNLLSLVDTLRDSDGSFTSFGAGMKEVSRWMALTSQVALNAVKNIQGFAESIMMAFTDAGQEGVTQAWDDMAKESEKGMQRLEDIWNGKTKLPAPKAAEALPEMANTKDSDKLRKMYRDLEDSQFSGSIRLTREFKSAHEARLQQVAEMQVSVEEKAQFEALSAKVLEQQKTEIYANGTAQRVDMDRAYQLGKIQQNELFLNSESAAQLASLENNRAIIDIQVQQWKAASESFRLMWMKVGVSIQDGALNGVQRGMEGILKGTMKASEAMKALGQSIIDSVVAAFSQMIAKLIIMQALGFVFGAFGGLFGGASKGFNPGASGNAGFSGGGAGSSGGLFKNLFDSGGYTGNVGTSNIAGMVHGGEYVFPARTTSSIGVSALDAIRAAGESGMLSSAGSYGGGSGGQPLSLSMFLDGQVLARALGVMSRDGTLELSASAIV